MHVEGVPFVRSGREALGHFLNVIHIGEAQARLPSACSTRT